VRDLPLEAIHKEAFKAAEASHCARDQGKYWEMYNRLFANQRQLGRDDLARHAQAVGLDMTAFQRCLDSGKHAETVRKDLAEAQRLGVTGTPTFFIGVAGPNDSEMKATKVVGAQPYAAFKAAIDRLLAAPK
jgi:predicted DsbA family dithiol-disulfide isomerase